MTAVFHSWPASRSLSHPLAIFSYSSSIYPRLSPLLFPRLLFSWEMTKTPSSHWLTLLTHLCSRISESVKPAVTPAQSCMCVGMRAICQHRNLHAWECCIYVSARVRSTRPSGFCFAGCVCEVRADLGALKRQRNWMTDGVFEKERFGDSAMVNWGPACCYHLPTLPSLCAETCNRNTNPFHMHIFTQGKHDNK